MRLDTIFGKSPALFNGGLFLVNIYHMLTVGMKNRMDSLETVDSSDEVDSVHLVDLNLLDVVDMIARENKTLSIPVVLWSKVTWLRQSDNETDFLETFNGLQSCAGSQYSEHQSTLGWWE